MLILVIVKVVGGNVMQLKYKAIAQDVAVGGVKCRIYISFPKEIDADMLPTISFHANAQPEQLEKFTEEDLEDKFFD